MRQFILSATTVLALSVCGPASALVTFDFTNNDPGVGALGGTSASFSSDGLGVVTTALNANEPPSPVLTQNIFGLGVRSGQVLGQVDNDDPLFGNERQEAIFFAFDNFVTVLSLDLGVAVSSDDWTLYGTNDAGKASTTTGGYQALTQNATQIATGRGNPLNDTAVTFADMSFMNFFIIADNATLTDNDNNAFRVSGMTVSAIPLPGGLFLFASVIGGLGLMRHRHGMSIG